MDNTEKELKLMNIVNSLEKQEGESRVQLLCAGTYSFPFLVLNDPFSFRKVCQVKEYVVNLNHTWRQALNLGEDPGMQGLSHKSIF